MASGSMHDVKAFGAVCDLDANPDVVALATPHQVPPPFGSPDWAHLCHRLAPCGGLKRELLCNFYQACSAVAA